MLELLADPQQFSRIRSKFIYLAWFKYRIRSCDADDIVQTAITSYYEVLNRYRGEKNQYGILAGIFRNKCLEYIDGSVREKRKIERFASKSDAQREVPWLNPEGTGASLAALEEVLRDEQGRLILQSLSELRPEAREMFRLLVDEELGRKGLIRFLKLNKNTLDSRLHVFRNELKQRLRSKGVPA